MVSTRANYQTETKKRTERYSDVTTDLSMHPVTFELSKITNENAVKRSIKNIILTNKNERLFNNKFGGNITSLLFEQMSPSTSDSLKHAINDAIITNEPRAKVSNIEVIADEHTQTYRVNIYFMVVNSEQPTGLTIFLQRVR